MTERGFITPPPGLLPEPPEADAPAPTPQRLAPPVFFPTPPGAAPSAPPQETAAQPVVAAPPVAPPTSVPVVAPVQPAQPGAGESATPPVVLDEPEAAVIPAAPGDASVAVTDWTLVIDGAPIGRIPEVLVLGRSPTAAVTGAQVLAVSGGGTVSATHAILRRDGDAISIEDLGSTNGSAVIAGGARTLLSPHQPMRLTESAEVWLAQAHLMLIRS